MPVLPRDIRVYRLGDRSFPIFSSYGAGLDGARWNSAGVPVIYAGRSLEGAVLEVLVHTDGLPPPSKYGWIWIDLPQGISFETVRASDLPGWRKDIAVTRAFGDRWVREMRSCVVQVPSIVVPSPYHNFLLNPAHPEFQRITYLKNPKHYRWDRRMFPQ